MIAHFNHKSDKIVLQMAQDWNSFILQLQHCEKSRVAQRPKSDRHPPPSLRAAPAETSADSKMATFKPEMVTGRVWCFNPDAPGSTGSKEDALWFDFKVKTVLFLPFSYFWKAVTERKNTLF
jgi:hypothetical protein